jgi:hypothetical protein
VMRYPDTHDAELDARGGPCECFCHDAWEDDEDE